MNFIEENCPHCSTEIEIIAMDQHGVTHCPVCNEKIYVAYSEECASDYSFCWDHYELFKWDEVDYYGFDHYKYFESNIIEG